MAEQTPRLPRMTNARRAALKAIGIESFESLLDWCAGRVAEAVNQENERTRTTANHARSWIAASTAATLADQPERLDPAIYEDWDDDAVYTVQFQFRDTVDKRDEGDSLDRSILAVSHHSTENDSRRFAGWDGAGLLEWLRSGVTRGVVPTPEVTPPTGEVEVPAAAGTQGESRTAEDRPVPTSSVPHINEVRAVLAATAIDLKSRREMRPVIAAGSRIEIKFDAPPPHRVVGHVVLTSVDGIRRLVSVRGAGEMLSSDPVRVPQGYHDAQVYLTDESTSEILAQVDLDTVLITEEST